jgi:hypothetical protein
MGIEAAPANYQAENNSNSAEPFANTALGSRFRLIITVNGGETRCELYDGGRGASVFRRAIALPSLSARDISVFAETLGDAVFTGNHLTLSLNPAYSRNTNSLRRTL